MSHCSLKFEATLFTIFIKRKPVLSDFCNHNIPMFFLHVIQKGELSELCYKLMLNLLYMYLYITISDDFLDYILY